MSFKNSHYFSVFVPSALLGFIAALQLTGCSDSPPGLQGETAGTGGVSAQGGAPVSEGGRSNAGESGDAGETAQAGEAGEGAGGAPDHPEGGSTASGGTSEAGGSSTASGGTAGGLTAGTGGQGGTLVEAVIPATCPFHTDPPLNTGGTGGGTAETGGTGGAGGTAGAGFTVNVQTSPFVGAYLADATGRTLYTYGNDLPGDCNTPPVSNCITDCLISWPIFYDSARVLAPGLDAGAFGAILRADGAWQTTYYGWPIYYYKTDLLPGQVVGQGKAKTWHIAEKKPPGVNIMRPGTVRYLGDVSGHTLYVSADDVAGTATSDPISNCTGPCLATFEPFREKNFSVVTSLLQADFGSFVRPGTTSIHVAYKGKPLYRAATDLKSGDMNGTSVTGFTAALP
jgi:predicted lipoprotein with Yx(FWY)xxD motif